jgi:hypothetical protein
MRAPGTDYAPGTSVLGIPLSARRFVRANPFDFDGHHGFGFVEGENFLKGAAADSRYAQVICIENEFGVHVSNCEIIENFGSLRVVARVVASRQPFAVG